MSTDKKFSSNIDSLYSPGHHLTKVILKFFQNFLFCLEGDFSCLQEGPKDFKRKTSMKEKAGCVCFFVVVAKLLKSKFCSLKADFTVLFVKQLVVRESFSFLGH